MTSETPSTRKTELASATGATSKETKTHSTGSKWHAPDGHNEGRGSFDEMYADGVSEAQAKAAARMLIGTLTQGNYYFQGIEDMAAYNVLKKWSEQK